MKNGYLESLKSLIESTTAISGTEKANPVRTVLYSCLILPPSERILSLTLLTYLYCVSIARG
jgi:hypothetical protein